jgi:uncharacterized protein YndB with AHSA1/START domain
MPDAAVTVTVTHRFAASPERVFDAWLSPRLIAEWMVAPAHDEMVRCELEARLGGAFCFVVRRAGEEIDHTGAYLEMDRPSRLAFTWCVPRYSAEATTVSLDLATDGTGTELTLRHDGVLPEYAERVHSGWSTILDAIDAALGAGGA